MNIPSQHTLAESPSAVKAERRTRVRFTIMVMLFLLTTLNYIDRSTLSITGTSIAREFHLTPLTIGYLFGAYGWSYVIAQLPGGWLVEKFGSRATYACSIGLWSILTLLMGCVGGFPLGIATASLFVLRVLIGAAEAPGYPINNRVTATWFAATERGTTSSVFISSKYFASTVFVPLMAFITQSYGWSYVYFFLGVFGLLLAGAWWYVYRAPRLHPRANEAELNYIVEGGAAVDMESNDAASNRSFADTWHTIKALCKHRLMIGMFFAQYCMTALTAFFVTWFPMYLIHDRGMSLLNAGIVSAIPGLAGLVGGIAGGVVSDALIGRGRSISFSRKFSIVVGLAISSTLALCNYTDSQTWIIVIMTVAFFGKAFGTQGWGVMAEIGPLESMGLAGSILNGFASIAGIVTPIVVGYLVQKTGNFSTALVFVSMHGLAGALCFLFYMGPLKRIVLTSKAQPETSAS
jgi:MFS transporter, ACS family, glucarate transporter